MDVSPLAWTLTIVFVVGLLLFDFIFHVRKAHTPSLSRQHAGLRSTWGSR